MKKDTTYFVDEMLTENIKSTKEKKKEPKEYDTEDDTIINDNPSALDKVKRVMNTTKKVSNNIMDNWKKYALGGAVTIALAKAGYNKYKGK
jgi:hypothetical protein